MYFREPIEAGGLIIGWKQISVHPVGDDLTYFEIPKGFFELGLVVGGWVSFQCLVDYLIFHKSWHLCKQLRLSINTDTLLVSVSNTMIFSSFLKPSSASIVMLCTFSKTFSPLPRMFTTLTLRNCPRIYQDDKKIPLECSKSGTDATPSST